MISQTDAIEIANILIGLVIPYIISYLKMVKWKDYHKFALAVAICAIVALLTTYADGSVTVGSYWQKLSTLFIVSQGTYFTFFRGFGWEKSLFPVVGAMDDVKEAVKQEVLDQEEYNTIDEIVEKINKNRT